MEALLERPKGDWVTGGADVVDMLDDEKGVGEEVVTWTLSGLRLRGGGVGTGGRGEDDDEVPCRDFERIGRPAEFTSGDSGRNCREADVADAEVDDEELLCIRSSTSSMDIRDGEMVGGFEGEIERTVDLINEAGGAVRALAM